MDAEIRLKAELRMNLFLGLVILLAAISPMIEALGADFEFCDESKSQDDRLNEFRTSICENIVPEDRKRFRKGTKIDLRLSIEQMESHWILLKTLQTPRKLV